MMNNHRLVHFAFWALQGIAVVLSVAVVEHELPDFIPPDFPTPKLTSVINCTNGSQTSVSLTYINWGQNFINVRVVNSVVCES